MANNEKLIVIDRRWIETIADAQRDLSPAQRADLLIYMKNNDQHVYEAINKALEQSVQDWKNYRNTTK